MTDPLSGKRAGLNTGETKQLTWEDNGEGCPVSVGDVFELQSCHVEITEVERRKRGKGESGQWFYVCQFTRYRKASKPFLLGRRGYTHDPKQAIKADLQDGDPREPEPEAVPPEEVAELDGDLDAYHRLVLVEAQARAAHEALPIEQRLASVQRAAKEAHIDISSEERLIARKVQEIERKVFDRAA